MSEPLRVTLVASHSANVVRAAALVRGLVASGVDVTVMARVVADGCLPAGVEHAPVPLSRRQPWTVAATAPILVARFAERTPHLVHALDHVAALAALPAAGAAGVAGIVASLGGAPPRTVSTRQPRGAAALVASVIDPAMGHATASLGAVAPARARFVALVGGERDAWATALGFERGRVLAMEGGLGVEVDTLSNRLSALRAAGKQSLAVERAPLVFGIAADPRRPDAATELVRRLRVRLPDVALVLLDERALAARLAVRFGSTDGARGEATLAALDALVDLDPTPAEPLRAATCAVLGVPSIGWDKPHLRDVVRPGHTGVLVRSDDISGLVDAVASYAAAPQTLRDHGTRARSLGARLFDADLAAARVLRLYDELLGGPGAEPLHLTPDGSLVGRAERRVVQHVAPPAAGAGRGPGPTSR